MLRYPSPSLVVSITALVVALGGAGYSTTGGNFILGKANSASTQTRLVAPFNGPAFRIENLSTGANATGLKIVTKASHPPLVVNSVVKVANLNADKLDGLSGVNFTRAVRVKYSLSAFGDTAPITLPPNQMSFTTLSNTTDGNTGIAEASLLRIPGDHILWFARNATGQSSFNAASGQGTNIIPIDLAGTVYLQVDSADTIRIHNGSASTQIGNVTLIW
jgi:hypothetical protein